MTEAAIYTRVSSREQQAEGFSLYAQARLLEEYAQQNRLRIVQHFEDVETARRTGRRQFARMVEFFRVSRCRVLLVEKTDRISRNFRDAVTLEDLDIEIHLVKEGQVISKDSKSQAVLLYGFNLVLARHYSNNLREEVKKGMREKAASGVFPGYAPFGYRNNRADRTVEPDPKDAPIAARIFTLYATGAYSLNELSRTLARETGRTISRSNLYWILNNPFYGGVFVWGGREYQGKHSLIVEAATLARARTVLADRGQEKRHTHSFAFCRMLRCACDGRVLTGDRKKERYVYYFCSRSGCSLPRLREQDVAESLGETLKPLQVSREAGDDLISVIERRWSSSRALVLWVEQTLTVAREAYSRYGSLSALDDKANLVKRFLVDCLVDVEDVRPRYRPPFDMIERRASPAEWASYYGTEVSFRWQPAGNTVKNSSAMKAP